MGRGRRPSSDCTRAVLLEACGAWDTPRAVLRRTLSAVLDLGLALGLALGLVAALGTLTACATPQRPKGPPGRAVIVHAADRGADAATLGQRLEQDGFVVALVPEGPSVRSASSAAIYAAARRPHLVEILTEAVRPYSDVTVLPFRQAGPEGTDVVVWLVATVDR